MESKMIEHSQMKEAGPRDLVKLVAAWLETGTKDRRIWVVIVVIVITLSLFWAGALVYAYVLDDLGPSPGDATSGPGPRSY